VQCFPTGGGGPKPVQLIFNLSSKTVAVGSLLGTRYCTFRSRVLLSRGDRPIGRYHPSHRRRSNSEDLGQYRALLVPVLCSERGNYVHRCLDYSAVCMATAAGKLAGALRDLSFLPVLLSRALARGQVRRGSLLTIRTTAGQQKPLRSLTLLLNFLRRTAAQSDRSGSSVTAANGGNPS